MRNRVGHPGHAVGVRDDLIQDEKKFNTMIEESELGGAIKDSEKRTGLSVDASKNNTNNPVSGKNIAKRLASQKKR